MGGSGGGGGAFVNRTPEELRDIVRKAEEKTTVAAFEAELSGLLGNLLGEVNGRDPHATRERLESIKATLQGEIDGSFDQFFGGSVAKHTYVEGLSDIDSLMLINDSDLEGKSPKEVLSKVMDIIHRKLGDDVTVSHGQMAVTVKYSDGMVIQLLPALESKDGQTHVPSSRTDGWSKIDPVAFTKALTKRNQECGNKLVPTIKLAKAINGQLPEAQRLAGYHMESLAIAAFKGYNGIKSPSAMLPTFFERAKDLVLSPIKDRTGQSVHVDEYLGLANSPERVAASHVLGRLARRMRNASAAGSADQWRALFGLD